MQKPAETRYPIHDLIRNRWSPVAFADRAVEAAKLASLFEAARWAPSSFNEQPWRFVIATRNEPEDFARLLSCLVEPNQAWAKWAPVLMISAAKMAFDRSGKENRHAFHDVGLAAENLVLQATASGLFVHQMAGFHVEKARELLEIPAGFEPVAAIALGYPGDPEALAEPLRQRQLAPRSRKPLEEIIFAGRWNRPSPIIAGPA
jgi:nitroreductase